MQYIFCEAIVQEIITFQKLHFTADIFKKGLTPVNFENTNGWSSHLNNGGIGSTVMSHFSSILI